MKKQGTIIRWDDGRGFGFLRSDNTPADVFFHVKDWVGGTSRPVVGLAVIYDEIHVGGKGPRGMVVRPVGRVPSPVSKRGAPPTPRRNADSNPYAMLLLIVAYSCLIGWCAISRRIAIAAALSVLLINGVTFLAYWIDKTSAQRGAWRTSEQTLHLLGLIGGWPAAWFAHRVLRHKSRKESFLAGYWLTVIANWAALLAWLYARTSS